MEKNNTAIKQCLNALTELEDDLANAKRASIFSNADLVSLSRSMTAESLKTLRDNLPQAVRIAGAFLDEMDEQREKTNQECEALTLQANNKANQIIAEANRTLAEANQTAQQTVAAATQQANQLVANAQAEAQNCVVAAQNEAANIIAQAQQQAEILVSQQDVLRRATVAAEELRAETEKEMKTLRKNTFDYLDALMGDADSKLTEIVKGLRSAHEELNHNRG